MAEQIEEKKYFIEVQSQNGILFPNKRKKAENHPDFVGAAEVNGIYMECSAWIRKDKKENDFIRIAFREPKIKQSVEER